MVGVGFFAAMVVVACGAREPVIEAELPVVPDPVVRPERPERAHYLGMEVPAHEPVPFPNVRRGCEPGERKACRGQIRSGPIGGPGTLWMHCVAGADGNGYFNNAACDTPLVVAFDEAPITFTNPAGSFAVGSSERTAWVSARTPWLALDLDGSGCIEGQHELFRFPGLVALDLDHDGRIDAGDPAFSRLVLWSDRDQDRVCTPDEVVGLAAAGIVALELAYTTPEPAAFGSYEGEHSSLSFRAVGDRAGELRRGRIVDVYLAPLP